MKTITTHAVMICIMLSSGACRTSKLSDRANSRLSLEQHADVKSRVLEVSRYARSEAITDSSGQSYELTIFPADTFKFSIQEGFTGKASKVIVKGSSRQLISKSSFSGSTDSSTSLSEANLTTDVTAKTASRSTAVKRKGVIWIGIGIGLVGVLLIAGIWRKVRVQRL